jgi:hypothetical protein
MHWKFFPITGKRSRLKIFEPAPTRRSTVESRTFSIKLLETGIAIFH